MMQGPATLVRLVQELVFVMLGLLLIAVAATGRLFWNRSSQMWIALGALVFVIGLRACILAKRAGAGSEVAVAVAVVRGVSLVLVGGLMLALTFVPFRLVAVLLTSAGGVLALRGALTAGLLLKMK